MSINNNEDSSLRQRLNLTAPTGEQLSLTQLSTGAVLNAEGSDNSIDIIGEETNYNNPAIRLMSGTTPILNIFSEKVECNKRIYINNKPIYLKTLNTNHSITYSSYNMDGVQISGFGDSNTPFFRVRSSNGNNYVMEAFTGKLNIYKHLFLENHLNVSGSTRLGNNVRVDNLEDNRTRLDLYCAETGEDLYNHNSLIRFLRTNSDRASLGYYAGPDKLSLVNKEGDIEIRSHTTGSEGGRIDLKSNGTIDLSPRSNNSVLNLYDNGIKFYKKIQWYDGTSEKGYARFADGNFEIQSNGCDLVLGKRGSQSSKTVVISDSVVNINEDVWLNTNALGFHNNGDDKHQILHSWGTYASPMNGLLFRGYGNTVPFCRFQGTSIETDVMDLYLDKIKMYKTLDMNSQQINLKAGDGSHYIKYSDADGMDGVEISGYGNPFVFEPRSGQPCMKFVSKNGPTSIFDCYPNLVSFNQKIQLNNYMIDFHGGNEDFHIKYNNDSGQNALELKGFNGVHLGNAANGNFNLKAVQDRVYITKMQVVDYINLENNPIRLRGFNDPSQIIGYASHNESGKNVHIDGWIIRGWDGSRLSSCMGSDPNLSQTHAAWFISNGQPRFGGPYGYDNYSDDRIKFEETTITDGLSTIMKLNPVLYKKGKNIGDTDLSTMKRESGFVAQEVYNNVPEMRHLVDFDKSLSRNFVDGDLNGNCVTDIYSKKTDSDGVTEEKPEVCTICYDEMIPFTVKAIQELNALVNTLQSTVNNLNQQIETQNTIISELQSKIP